MSRAEKEDHEGVTNQHMDTREIVEKGVTEPWEYKQAGGKNRGTLEK